MAFKERSEKGGFTYKRRSKEDIKAMANRRGGSYDNIFKDKFKVYKLRDGKNVIRILPPSWEDARHYGYSIFVNYGIGVDNQSYLSLSKMKGEPDPLAEGRRDAEKEGHKKVADKLRPNERVAMWVIDRLAEDEGPQLFNCPFSVDRDFSSLAVDEDSSEVLYIDDPEEGYDLRFHKEGVKLNTKYPGAKMKLLGPNPIHEDQKQQREWLKYVAENPVPDCLQFYDYDHIAAAFDGHVDVDEDEDEDERPKRRPASRTGSDDEDDAPRRPRRRPVAEEPEDAEDEPDEPDDEEAPKKPAPRRGRAEPEDEDEETEVAASSIRERLKRRQPEPEEEADEEETSPPRRRVRP